MQYVGKVFSTVSQLYKELNPATLSGAIDVVVVEDKDGNFSCSPFHVRFGKLQLLRPSDKAVQVIVNDKPAEFYMKVGDSGEGFFVLETESDVPSQFVTSPVASPSLSYRIGDDPDFLDLGANNAADQLNKDGYVSAPSAHGSESDPESEPEDSSNANANNSSSSSDDVMVTTRSWISNPDTDRAHSDNESNIGPHKHWNQHKPLMQGQPDASAVAFHDDMALPIGSNRPSERILHQLDLSSPAAMGGRRSSDRQIFASRLRSQSNNTNADARTLSLLSNNAGASAGTGAGSLVGGRVARYKRRTMSAVSDSAFELDAFPKLASSGSVGAGAGDLSFPMSRSGNGGSGGRRDDDSSSDRAGSGGLHSEWDWGVKITPTPHTGEATAEPLLAVSDSNDINGVDDKTAADVRQPDASEKPNKHALDVSALLEVAVARGSASSSPVLEISLCGIEALQVAVDATYQQRIFDGACVQAQTFEADPIGIITNPSLVFRQANGEYVQGEALVIALVSQLAFGLPLDRCLQYQQSSVAGGSTSAAAVITLPGLAQQSSQLRVSGVLSLEPAAINAASASAERIVAEIDSSSLNIGDELAASSATAAAAATSAASSAVSAASKPEGRRWWRWGQRTASTAQPDADSAAGSVAKTLAAEADPADAVAIRMPLQPVEANDPYSTHDGMSSADEAGGAYMSDDGALVHPVARQRSQQHSLHYAKTLRMTSEQLKSLGLRQGANDIKFLVPSNKAYCEAKLYLYRYDTQIVISDIDGTITKSDALGHLFNMVGKDWTHQGVAKLYTDIANNGYEILYLTSRAIGQADGTRYFLNNVKQGQFKLPGGPLLLSPDRLFTSFHREVIMRRPQEFKMACLRDIKNLFGDQSPFYAGFGNRITDAMSYRSVNVPVSRICTIDTYGEIKLDLLPGYKSSYVKINDLVDMMFPALSSKLDPKYNDWEYWKPNMPEIDDELAEIDAMLALEANAAANKSKPGVNTKGTVPAAMATASSLPNAARRISISSPSYMFPRTSRAQSSIGSPAQNQKSPLSHLGGHRHHQQDLALGTPALSDTAVRQRADSWASSTQTALPPNVSDSSRADAKSAAAAADALHVEAAPAAAAGDADTTNGNNSNISGGHLNLLKKASSALSPFNLVRGSSPPPPPPPPPPSSLPSAIASTPSGSDLRRVADGECTSVSDKGDDNTPKALSPPASASCSEAGFVSDSSSFAYADDPIRHSNVAKNPQTTNVASFNFAKPSVWSPKPGSKSNMKLDGDASDNNNGDEGDDSLEDDPALVAAAARLVPHISARRINGGTGFDDANATHNATTKHSSRASVRSNSMSTDGGYNDYSDEDDVDTDIDNDQDEDDDEDEDGNGDNDEDDNDDIDEDDIIDQDTLDIMHDMEQVQHL